MIIKSLYLRNFKGAKDSIVDFSEYGNIIAGENASGKTTYFDAFTWLLFGKDSTDRQKFNIKTIDPATGESFHSLTHSVTGEFVVSGKPLTLERRYYEVWSRRRGDASQRLTGHTTDFFINGAPVSNGEYQSEVEAMTGDVNLFKVITNVLYFSAVLPWKERRKMLFDMAGHIGADEKILALKSFAPLAEALDGKTVDRLQRELAARMKETRQELERIPVRIDELTMRIPASCPDAGSLREEKDAILTQLNEIENELGGFEAAASKEREKARAASDAVISLERQLSQMKASAERRHLEKEHGKSMRITHLDNEAARIDSQLSGLSDKIKSLNQIASETSGRLQEIKKLYQAETDSVVEITESDTVCPTCGQQLPEEMRSAKIESLRASIEAKRAMRLRNLENEGRSLRRQIADAEAEIATTERVVAELKEKRAAAVKECDELRVQTSSAPAPQIDPERVALEKQLRKAQDALAAVTGDIPQPPEELTGKRSKLMERADAITAQIAEAEAAQRDQTRIAELEAQQSRLADELASCEKTQILCDDFIMRRAKYTEKHINSMFKSVQWELFRTQVNGGIEECCEALIDGVPYSDANTAARINAGLEIIDTISRHYNVQAPIFIDNAEAVLNIAPVPLQIIELRAESGPLTVRERI